MDFALTPTQIRYRDSAGTFAQTCLALEYDTREPRGSIEHEIRQGLGQLGLIAPELPTHRDLATAASRGDQPGGVRLARGELNNYRVVDLARLRSGITGLANAFAGMSDGADAAPGRPNEPFPGKACAARHHDPI